MAVRVDPLRRVDPLHRVDSLLPAPLGPLLRGYHRHPWLVLGRWQRVLPRELRRVRLLDRHLLLRAQKSASKLQPKQLRNRQALVGRVREQQLERMKWQLPPLRPRRHAQLLA
jgi:hypothetical protein